MNTKSHDFVFIHCNNEVICDFVVVFKCYLSVKGKP